MPNGKSITGFHFTAMRSILFVCTANRCRSPLAAGLLAHQVQRRVESANWQIGSAGTWTIDNQPATTLAQLVMSEKGINLESHRSRGLNADMLRAADVILVMTRYQLEAICAEFRDAAGKTFLLSQLIGQKFDIDDPFEGTLEDYRRCANDIDQILNDGFPRLIELADRRTTAVSEVTP